MGKIKTWLIEKFLPAWAKETIYNDNAKLRMEIQILKQQIREQARYIDGLERGIRSQRRVVIHNEVSK